MEKVICDHAKVCDTKSVDCPHLVEHNSDGCNVKIYCHNVGTEVICIPVEDEK